jgi:hypothetical protein
MYSEFNYGNKMLNGPGEMIDDLPCGGTNIKINSGFFYATSFYTFSFQINVHGFLETGCCILFRLTHLSGG